MVGTRPEVVKMAPLVARLQREGSGFVVRVVSTGQHRGLLDQALSDFGIKADVDLALMQPNQGLADLTARALTALGGRFAAAPADLVLAQGDTTTVLATALACHYQRIPFGHVEAGLRTGDPYQPFPEEKNRELADHLAELHFAPTPWARANLVREGIPEAGIHVTGNTVIDALQAVAERNPPLPLRPATARFLLVTAHRRESFGAPLGRVVAALGDLVARHDGLSVVFPMHPNPNVRAAVGVLEGHPRIHLIEPVAYPCFVALLKAAFAILTDSGGVQEEAPAFGRPVLVLRETTERPEGIEAGAVQLVGTDRRAIVAAVEELLARPERAGRALNPYGDGWASERIVRVLCSRFGIDPGPEPSGYSARWPR
ncbi:MAG: UDP-N-acetylglucosamine 2-epimerase (non-hydrolyzing) [Isosphaeraceae bacterium]|nr:UDP-N-acetylglucosamine 2-epimerase (non-hydrolyzing) [Isosphaeraceae bacterium]